MLDPASIYLMTSAVLFSIGAMGVAIRRNPLVMFMCIELMLNASNLAFAGFAKYGQAGQGRPMMGGPGDGTMFVFLVMIVAAAEAVIGLGIIIAIFRSRANVDVDELAALKG